MREYWDKLVPVYDLNSHRKWFWSSPYSWADEIAQRVTDCKKVLDIGGGAGALSIALSRKFDLYSLDFSLDMLTQLKRRKDESEVEVEMINADAQNIHFKDKRFDAVICRFAIWPLSNPNDAIEEIVRVAKNKVVIIVGD
jgi:ubiquinone/menaquinone biosynthesis C-methylase UbiE